MEHTDELPQGKLRCSSPKKKWHQQIDSCTSVILPKLFSWQHNLSSLSKIHSLSNIPLDVAKSEAVGSAYFQPIG
jgi:hypothetical protein